MMAHVATIPMVLVVVLFAGGHAVGILGARYRKAFELVTVENERMRADERA